MRTFEVTITDNWIEKQLDYIQAETHKQVADQLPLKNKRVYNERFREIETTGKYYRISHVGKGGQAMIFEINYISEDTMKKPLFSLQTKEKENLVFAHIYRGKVLIMGTAFKTGTPLAEIEQWAIKRITTPEPEIKLA